MNVFLPEVLYRPILLSSSYSGWISVNGFLSWRADAKGLDRHSDIINTNRQKVNVGSADINILFIHLNHLMMCFRSRIILHLSYNIGITASSGWSSASPMCREDKHRRVWLVTRWMIVWEYQHFSGYLKVRYIQLRINIPGKDMNPHLLFELWVN